MSKLGKEQTEITLETAAFNAALQSLKDKIEQLRDLVWLEDIPSPTVPEYVEHHASIQKILTFIDTELLKEDDHE